MPHTGVSISDSLRYAEDFCNACDCLLSQNQKSIFLVTVTNDQVAFNDPAAVRVVTKERITIADGYREWTANLISPYDGYLYPRIDQLHDQIQGLSHNQLSDITVLVGSLVLPYNYNGIVGGYDPLNVFQPKQGAGISNQQIYLQIFGYGLPDTANYFSIKSIVLSGPLVQEGVSFKLIATANGKNLGI